MDKVIRGRYFSNGKYKQKTIKMPIVTDNLGFIFFSQTAEKFKSKIEEIEKCPIRLIWTQILD